MTQTVIAQATGTIEVEGDSDWFKVSLTAGNEYVFNVGSGTLGANGTLSLYDSNGNAVPSVTSGSQIVFQPTSTGTYYVGAAGVGAATGTYTILESTASFDVTGNTSTTGTVAVGGHVTGTLTASGQSEWYKVSLTAGTGYELNVSGALPAGQVALYDSQGNLVASGNAGSTLTGNSTFYVPTASGTYYVAASDTQGGGGAFTVSVNTASYDFAGNTHTTGTVAVGGTVTGTLANVGQSDWFAVTLTAGKEYVFDLTGNSGLLPGVAVYNSAGTAVAGTLYTGGASGGALVTYEPTVSGTYYVSASSNISTTGGFSLAVSTATPDFLGTTQTTGTISVGGNATGTISASTQSDWFKVSLTAGSAYNISTGTGTLKSAAVTVYDSNGNALTGGAGQTLFEPTSSGTYYIGASGSGTGTFTVSLAAATVDHLGTIHTTASIPVGQTLSGTLANAGQSDWYKVTLTAGTQYVFTETGGTLSTPEVGVYDSNGARVALSTDGGTGGVSTISFTASTSGTYFVGASSLGSTTGTYTLTAATHTDDHSDTTSTTGTFTQTLTADAAIAENAAGSLAAGSKVIDYAAAVQNDLDGLQALVAAGKVTSITLSDATTPTITVTAAQVASDAATLKEISSPFTLNISGASTALSAFVQGQSFSYSPGVTHPGSDQVVEVASVKAGAAPISLGNGYNVVLVDGAHSTTASTSGADSFSFNVLADGTVTLHDNNTGQNQTVSGDTYLIFNGGATNTDGSFQSIYFIGSSTATQVTSLYNAAFLRLPDLGGLEFYTKPITAGTFDLHQAAVYFLASPEFATDYPTASKPADHGGPNDVAFINTLYNNVLHRTASAAEVAFYVTALQGTYDRASLLEFFALSPENQANISGFIVDTANGAYADSSALASASTVLSEASSSAALNLAAIAPSSIGTGVSTNGISIAANDAVTLTSSAPTETVYLSSTFSTITVQNSGSTIIDAASGSTITLSGAANTTLTVSNGGGLDLINLVGGTGTTVNGFTAGSGATLNITGQTSAANVQVLDGSTTKVAGTSLTFSAGTSYVVNIGSVADHTAATIAAAANKAYTATGTTDEAITFIAKDASGNTLVWSWTTSGGADVNHNHLVDANELINIATIVGVAPSALTANDLG